MSPQASLGAAGSRHEAMEGEEEQLPQEVRDRAARGSKRCGVPQGGLPRSLENVWISCRVLGSTGGSWGGAP